LGNAGEKIVKKGNPHPQGEHRIGIKKIARNCVFDWRGGVEPPESHLKKV
jgi:hypothetical protein